MKLNIFKDIRTATGVYKAIREGRKNGNEVQI